MLKLLTQGLIIFLTAGQLVAGEPVRRYHALVETRIGTDLHGHTYPGASAPFGMVQLSPDTRTEGWDACSGYHYSDSTLLGFSHTHLSGTGIADYGDILVTPTIRYRDPELGTADSYRLRFTHDQESVSAGFYQVRIADSGIGVELTVTERVGVHRYTFPPDESGSVIVNLAHGLGPDEVIGSEIRLVSRNQVSGYRRSSGWARDQQVFFFLESSKPFAATRIFRDGILKIDADNVTGTDLRCVLMFETGLSGPVMIKVGLSFVSTEEARKNLEAEVPGWDFDQVRRATAVSWDKELGKIDVEGGTTEQQQTFYTALYRTMLAPNIASDVNRSYRGMDQRIYRTDQFTPYTVFSLWDTFRAEHPLLALIDRKRTGDFVQTLLAKYDQSGVLPVWELASNETWTMIGYHSAPVILDAYVKGIGGFSAAHAYDAMKASAMMNHYGLEAYRSFGYIPADKEGESVSKTLEYAYDDWCIGRMAELVGLHGEAEYFFRRSASYRNLFDPETQLMRPKSNSTWVEPFDSRSVTFHYTEANPWQYSFFAPHDPAGLIELMGGGNRFAERLDSLFLADPRLAGRQQPDITGLIGQYAHGNEPSHHVAYLYNYAGQPWKTQRVVRTIMDSLYMSTPDGLCGNEDCGQMSAWYVMSALGFYQVCPGEPVYAIGTPLFPKSTVHLENGRRFVVSAEGTSSERRFVRDVGFNGATLSVPFLHHDSLMAGGTLRFTMASEPVT
ncbi:MAG: GH92 family glycosyl hydrolase, partial [Ignavibacteria bacterium]|nr:GH92 family glycosyl hydrolase [Ignavibacteria bacterium]